VSDEELQYLQLLVGRRLGLFLRTHDLSRLRRASQERATRIGLKPVAYVQFLSTLLPEAEREWQELASLLTIHETYFFRDQGQLALLRRQVLPELVRARAQQRRLRLWSAGCSTGEEAYTLGILLSEVLPELSRWDVRIVGSDLSSRAVALASQGSYGSWSFRLMEAGYQERYFTRHGDAWQVVDWLRAITHFQTGNLVLDPLPNPALQLEELDLILCRNVLIYLDRALIPDLAQRFFAALRPGGYLVTGHAELPVESRGGFSVTVHADSVLFRRPAPGEEAGIRRVGAPGGVTQRPGLTAAAAPAEGRPLPTGKAPVLPPRLPTPGARPRTTPAPREPGGAVGGSRRPGTRPAPTAGGTESDSLRIRTLLRLGSHREALVVAQDGIRTGGPRGDLLYLAGRASANLGEHRQAQEYCRQAIVLEPYYAPAHGLLGEIADVSGDRVEARAHLRRAIYVQPEFIAGYLGLAGLHEDEGDRERAHRHRETARRLLRALPPGAVVEPYYELTAQRLLEQLEQFCVPPPPVASLPHTRVATR